MKKILIFGGAGYLGSTLTNLLLNKGYQVRVVDNFFKGSVDTLIPFVPNPNFEFMFGNVTHSLDVQKTFENVDACVFMAAMVGFPICNKYPEQAILVNVEGARNVAFWKPKQIPLIYTSTGSVYGTTDEICNEEVEPYPPSLYGQTKLSAEKELLVKDSENTVIHRYATAMGCGFNSTRINLLVNDLVYRAMSERIINIFEADFMRTFIHCNDICSAILFTLENFNSLKYNVYNVGNNNLNLTKRHIANFIAEKTGCNVQFIETAKDLDKRNYKMDNSRFYNEGWSPKIGLEETIDELIKLYPLLKPDVRYN